ncbi:MAG: molybdenum cofactor guanylyltransferase [Acidithiobacillus sp.]|nr:molybdenum cofactor guanylyltransferase [Acidithiobacillus sp.]
MQQSPIPAILPVSALILAGGAGSRMGGVDKGWLSFQGQPLIEHALRPLRPYAREILISANREQARYGALGYAVLSDAESGFPGPLHGLLAGLETCREAWLAFVPVDCPLLPDDLLPRLWSLRRGYPLVAVADDQGLVPVMGLIHRRIQGPLRQYLRSGKRRATEFLASLPHQTLPLADSQLLNCNYPADLRAESS